MTMFLNKTIDVAVNAHSHLCSSKILASSQVSCFCGPWSIQPHIQGSTMCQALFWAQETSISQRDSNLCFQLV